METRKTDIVIRAEKLLHKGAEQIALRFPYNHLIRDHLKKLDGIEWTQTHGCYYIANTPDAIHKLLNHCRGMVWVDMRKLDSSTNRAEDQTIVLSRRPSAPCHEYATPHEAVCIELVKKVADLIVLRGYSIHTLKSYVNHIKTYLRNIATKKSPLEMTKAEIEQYLLERGRSKHYSESDTNMHINAIKFLYEQVLGKERMLFYLPRPEKPLQLPKVLGEHELERLFRSIPNLKHKAILLTAFSCGLRVGEVIKLRIRDIDSERMQIFIERSKVQPVGFKS